MADDVGNQRPENIDANNVDGDNDEFREELEQIERQSNDGSQSYRTTDETESPINVEDDHPASRALKIINARMRCLEDGVELLHCDEAVFQDLAELNAIKSKFDELLEEHCDDRLIQVQREFSIRFRELRNHYFRLTRKRPFSSSGGSNSTDQIPVKLPALSIPTFHGELEKWSNFKSRFLNLISDIRVKDNDATKKDYLYAAVSGEAVSMIENVKDCDFDTIFKILLDFYDDPFRRANAHYDGLFKTTGKGATLRQRLVQYRQHATGLSEAYKELRLDPFEQVLITHFLQNNDTKPGIKLQWERRLTESPSNATLTEFYKFLEKEASTGERAFGRSEKPSSSSFKGGKPFKSSKFGNQSNLSSAPQPGKGHTLIQAQQPECIRCGVNHFLNQCPDFRHLTPVDRLKFVTEKELCTVCLKKNCIGIKQFSAKCPLKNKLQCYRCKKAHNTILHIDGESSFNNIGSFHNKIRDRPIQKPVNLISELPIDGKCLFNNNVARNFTTSLHRNPLIATVSLSAQGTNTDRFIEIRALLDNGSQFNFITKRMVDNLKLPVQKTKITVSGIGPNSTPIRQYADVNLFSRCTPYKIKTPCLIVDQIITSLIPQQFFEINSWNLSSKLRLADPGFNIPGEIDLLLGLDVFWQILENQTYRLSPELPRLQKTKFGWIIAGSILTSTVPEGTAVFFVQSSKNELLEQMEKFWVLENLDKLPLPLTSEEQECERIFQESVYRNEEGRFVVPLLFRLDPSLLGESRTEALRQFGYLERRLSKNEQMRAKYVACMNEYINLGHMREVVEMDKDKLAYYMPHHAVINPMSSSTNQRTVFNASQKTSSGFSLNDLLHTGFVVQSDLISILIGFRLYLFVLCADIVKMYRQILINLSQTIFQRIFWRASPQDQLKVYELLTLTFGERPAPYLATRCLKELALKYGAEFPLAVKAILDECYMDNFYTGANSIEEAKLVRDQLITLCNSAGFPLSKWCSNAPELLAGLGQENLETILLIGGEENGIIKTLGMFWSPTDDKVKIWFNRPEAAEAHTKRQILSVIASIFDPMGLVGPVTVVAKCFMQEIWKSTTEPTQKKGNRRNSRVHWDEKVEEKLLFEWKQFASNLPQLNNIIIPRYALLHSSNVVIELHGFADASSKAYGAVIYCRVIDDNNQVRVSLISSKSRVAPLRQHTIARLELCAAVLLVELVEKISAIFTKKVNINCIRLWSDSQIALSWINSPSYKWNVFVAHRVSKIQSLSENCVWDYVTSENNPADILSRGVNPNELTTTHDWFIGPWWLRDTAECWTESSKFLPNPHEMEERRPIRGLVMTTVFKSDIFNLVNIPPTGPNSVELIFKHGYSKLVRMVAYLNRFRYNSRPFFPRARGRQLLMYELRKAREILIEIAQREFFSSEIECLKAGRPISNKSSLKSLNPFIDSKGILRVGGRLHLADMSFEQRHPAILHPSHKLSDLIILHEHLTHLHAGPKFVKSILRRKFWILRLNGAVKRVLGKCHTCIRFKAQVKDQLMCDLPKSRITPSKPFTHTGVDYAGPFQIIEKGGRHKTYIKAYIAVFVCFATKANHLEVVHDLSTESFLEVFENFIARRGIPTHMYSDNGTNFVGASGKLNEVYSFIKENSDNLGTYALNKGFEWHFIPPRAPHFGGIWEASVKMVKSHLQKTIGPHSLNIRQLDTLLKRIEACLNSRPLFPESVDPNDLNALTPGHFLTGGPLTALPSKDFTNIPDNRLKHWEASQKLVQSFWKRWSSEYLTTLQQRFKWREVKENLKVGDFVIIKEENLFPTQWKLGRVQETQLGKDGLCRTATIKTATGLLKRAIAKLVYLPSE